MQAVTSRYTLASTPPLQHQNSLIYKHENKIIDNFNIIQQLIKIIVDVFKIDISPVGRL